VPISFCHIRLAVFLHVSAWPPLDGFTLNLILGDFYESMLRKYEFA